MRHAHRKKSNPSKIGATPGKLAVVGLLSIVLIFVVFRGAGKNSAVRPRAALAASSLSEVVVNPQGSKPSEERKADVALFKGDWPQIAIDNVVAFDPLGTVLPGDDERAALAGGQQEDTEGDATLAGIKESGSAIVLLSGGEKIARYGTLELRIGDKVGDYRVRDISSEGVVLSEH
ncbi:hypothetical protein [Adhaeretor mobilis]|uniref:Uncharacterized protein n=1 Tax=Adhaeretor mobilis TaxID=1930276 RepID=A0A517MVQ3_9BACT|nr:hypothetical protein [Adhaeretor mobilis]QDS98950.1 hypothetical protein HG15A2_22380 [Adhaeretor mobilis]